MNKIVKLTAAAGLLCVLFAATHWRSSQWKDVCIMPFRKDERSAAVILKKGQSVKSFVREVEDAGLIADSGNLLYRLVRSGLDRTLKAGTYQLHSGSSAYVVAQLKRGVPAYVKETVLPGAKPDSPLPLGDAELQCECLADDLNYPAPMREILPAKPEARAAFLLPDTYMLAEKSPEALVQAASSAWWKIFGGENMDAETAFRSAVIASLIQREALVDREYPVVAGVIENRLKKKMLLQIDASVVYAWYLKTGESLKRVLYRHLEIDSPYNTYKHPGLPPQPICVPSRAAWEGALRPESHKFYYYVAKGDGTHFFAETMKQHERNVLKYRRRAKKK